VQDSSKRTSVGGFVGDGVGAELSVGFIVGVGVGLDGAAVGASAGPNDGFGDVVGMGVGARVGSGVGKWLGLWVGCVVGLGEWLGAAVGSVPGSGVATIDGLCVGSGVGRANAPGKMTAASSTAREAPQWRPFILGKRGEKIKRDKHSDAEHEAPCERLRAGARPNTPNQGMVIRITQSSQIELADWLGIIGTTRRRGTIFPQN
jgi:hypothetical protein